MTTITHNETHDGCLSLALTCGKKSATVFFGRSGRIYVCCQNAAHSAWRGTGKTFTDIFSAINAYKSFEMKAMIKTAAIEYNKRQA